LCLGECVELLVSEQVRVVPRGDDLIGMAELAGEHEQRDAGLEGGRRSVTNAGQRAFGTGRDGDSGRRGSSDPA
jgi:hypothetical protein